MANNPFALGSPLPPLAGFRRNSGTSRTLRLDAWPQTLFVWWHGYRERGYDGMSRVRVGFIFATVATALCLCPAVTLAQEVVRSGANWTAARALALPPAATAALLTGNVNGAHIGPITLSGARHAVYVANDTVATHDIVIDGLTATDLQREGIRIRGQADGWTIRNVVLQMRAEPQVRPELPTGIAIYGGKNILIEDATVSGFTMVKVPKRYTNGDGIAAENTVSNLTLRRITSSDSSDAGFDLKIVADADDLTAARNSRNYRLWRGINAGTLTSIDAKQAHIWMQGKTAPQLKIERLVVRSTTTAPILLIENATAATSVEIGSCDLQVPRGTKFWIIGKAVTAHLGPGCKL